MQLSPLTYSGAGRNNGPGINRDVLAKDDIGMNMSAGHHPLAHMRRHLKEAQDFGKSKIRVLDKEQWCRQATTQRRMGNNCRSATISELFLVFWVRQKSNL